MSEAGVLQKEALDMDLKFAEALSDKNAVTKPTSAVQSSCGLKKLGGAKDFQSLRSQGMLRHFKIDSANPNKKQVSPVPRPEEDIIVDKQTSQPFKRSTKLVANFMPKDKGYKPVALQRPTISPNRLEQPVRSASPKRKLHVFSEVT